MPRKSRIVATKGGKRGPVPKPVDLDKVRLLASNGLTVEQIANAIGMSECTFREKRKQFPEISRVLMEGKAQGIHVIANALFKKARDGDTQAQIFFLKARAGWKDRLELSGDPENPVHHVISAKPLTAEEWEEKYGEKVIEGETIRQVPPSED